MRKCVLFLMIAVLLLFSGCNLIQNLVGNNKPSPSPNVTTAPKPSQAPKPVVSETPLPSPEEEGPPLENTEVGGHLFGGSNAPSSSGETTAAAGNSAVQDAQLQVFSDQSLSSKDDVVYTENASIRADYDGNGTLDILKLDFFYDYPERDDMSFPVKITMSIGESSVVYENTWNGGGVAVGIADFDTSDAELDIYIISLGTDVSAYVQTYWYDGSVLDEYTWFEIIEDTSFWYDTNGYIYYKGQYEDVYGVMVGLNFYTGEVFTVD